MRIAADNLYATVDSAMPEELAWLQDYLTVPVKNAEHAEAYQAGHWDGTVRLYDKRRNRIASGLIRLVAGRAKESGVTFEIRDIRVKPPGAINEAAGAWLRDYQREALGAMLRRGRGIVMIPTGGGKTSVAAGLFQSIPIQWLMLVDTKDLMHQGAKAVAKWTQEDVGECGDGTWRPRRITVATLQTLSQGLGKDGRVDALLERTQGILCDEVQVASAVEANRVLMSCPSAYYRYGVSATPLEREDESDYRAIEALGPLIYEVSAKTLIDAGWLARPEIYFVEFDHERMTGSYSAVYEAGIVLSEKRNALVAKLAGADHCPRPTLVFFRSIPHGPKLERLISPHASTEVIDGRKNTWSRDHARVRLNTGQIDVLLTSRIFGKGMDIPFVESAVNGGGGKSSTDAVQKVGRIMRVVGEKRSVRYWDILDRRNRWLENHARARLDAFRGRGYDVKVISASDVASIGRAA